MSDDKNKAEREKVLRESSDAELCMDCADAMGVSELFLKRDM